MDYDVEGVMPQVVGVREANLVSSSPTYPDERYTG